MERLEARSDGVHFVNAGDAFGEDSLDPCFEGHRRQRATTTRSNHLQIDGSTFDAEQHEIASISLQSGADVFESRFEHGQIDLRVVGLQSCAVGGVFYGRFINHCRKCRGTWKIVTRTRVDIYEPTTSSTVMNVSAAPSGERASMSAR